MRRWRSCWRALRAVLREQILPTLAAEGIQVVDWSDLDTGRPEVPGGRVRRPDLPHPDAAGGGSRPSFPVPLEPLDEPRGAFGGSRQQPALLRPHQGAVHLREAAEPARRRALHPHRAGHLGPSRGALPGHGDPGARRLPGDAQRRPVRRRSGGRGPADGGGGRVAAAPVPRRGPPGDVGVGLGGDAQPADGRVGRPARRRLHHGLPPARGRPQPVVQTQAGRPAVVAAPPVRASPLLRPHWRGHTGLLCRHPQRRRAGAPPLRLVRRLGAGVHPPGGGGSRRAGHQDDPLPHRRRRRHRGGARGGRRTGASRWRWSWS